MCNFLSQSCLSPLEDVRSAPRTRHFLKKLFIPQQLKNAFLISLAWLLALLRKHILVIRSTVGGMRLGNLVAGGRGRKKCSMPLHARDCLPFFQASLFARFNGTMDIDTRVIQTSEWYVFFSPRNRRWDECPWTEMWFIRNAYEITSSPAQSLACSFGRSFG